ncbi:ABATE domain-containing protein [Streptomyces litchfieldiae]|uniref:ABATE domain-containing protein n=1 Tax=Streptomyces litchfieldiae TaxID=3075543 RepID=A0ABU2MHQ3_9ACTN|nr:ABATE domain-containing protein [Streptomyces sp. DSM 44938]MDT0341106.1 ABATE domain-containing protein [Streptomyces sp. DSM 44938]
MSPSPPPTDPEEPGSRLALALAVTIRHDGHGGVADDLRTPDGLTAWVTEHAGALRHALDAREFIADGAALSAVRALREAVRALFARAVRPGPPSRADAHRLLPEPEAVARLNAAAALVPAAPALHWPPGAAAPTAGAAWPPGPPAADRLTAALAHDAIAFLAGPDRARLRACQGPRCVRYFMKDHPRQEWCKPSCGNRARVARHHRRHRAES